MGDVVQMPPSGVILRADPDGAGLALVEIGMSIPGASADAAEMWADWVNMELWKRGFAIVPFEPDRGA